MVIEFKNIIALFSYYFKAVDMFSWRGTQLRTGKTLPLPYTITRTRDFII
jgi:hypothetical protein